LKRSEKGKQILARQNKWAAFCLGPPLRLANGARLRSGPKQNRLPDSWQLSPSLGQNQIYRKEVTPTETMNLHLLHSLVRTLELALGWVLSPSWLPPKDFQLMRWLITPGYGYGFLLITFAMFELAIPQDRRRWSRASLLSGTYVVLAAKMGVYAMFIALRLLKHIGFTIR
jgi:hypothetical protein